ncbi:NADH-quinone oxidoreductase subunit N [Ekhidna sp.]|uniref:NADH-quinone oxidoreductase subunit N n=1 Tax=Ekhidna sp. TaxID=2608089 RepID=UPI003BABCCA8
MESSLMLGAILVLIIGLFRPNQYLIKAIFLIVLIVAFAFNQANSITGILMMESILLSPISKVFGALFLIASSLIVLYRRSKEHAPEFYFFIIAMIVGSLFMIKANNLLVIYLAIELVSFGSYILTNFSFQKKSFEASLKYLLFGAISSAIMLFGIGLIYGSTGTLYLSEWATLSFEGLVPQVGFLMLLFGIFFKISIFPSHVWVPATYESAPVDATAFMSVVPKLAGLVLLKHLMEIGFFPKDHIVYELILVLGIVTIIIGTLGAFMQSNVRRMISFGAIAHSGFLLPFAIMSSETSYEAFWFYSVIYMIMNFGVFYLLDECERKDLTLLKDYSNSSISVWIGGAFTLILISLVGLPPLSGFSAKFFLFSTLWEYYQSSNSGYFLSYLIVTLLATVGSLFFYLKIPKHIFLSSQADSQSINFSFSTKIIATLFCIVLLLLFFVPQLVMEAQHLLNNVHE